MIARRRSRAGGGVDRRSLAQGATERHTLYDIGPFQLDGDARVLTHDGAAVALGARAVTVLATLVGHANEFVSKVAILEAAWPGLVVEEGNLAVQISAIRRALALAPGGDTWIQTLARRGYRFVGPVARPAERSQVVAAPAEEKPSIAVLPFANRGHHPEDEYFSDGLADELLNVLAKIRGLRVAARTSSFQFKGKNDDVAVIGRKLKVATLLEGSVRKSGNRLRISVQLVKVNEGYQLWSQSYDRTLEDIFAVQDDIAQSVVKELRGTLLGEAAAANEGCESPEHRALVWRQQRVAPVERRAQGLLPRRGGACAGQQPQALAEPLAQILQPQRGDACGRHLDRQRQAVELAAQVDRGIEICCGEREATIGRDCSRYQQRHGAIGERLFERYPVRRDGKGVQAMNRFRRDLERLLRRHEPTHARRLFHRIANQDGHVAEHVLAVVERDNGLDLRERREQPLTSLGGGTDLDVQALPQSVIDLGTVAQRRKLDPVNAIARIADTARERGARQRCLAHAAGADDADQRKCSDHVRERGEIRVPAEQQRRAGREVGCHR